MPRDTDNNTGFLISTVILNILMTIHIAYIFYNRVIWGGNLINKIGLVGMILVYMVIFIMSLTIISLPDTSDYGVNIFLYFGILTPLFNLGMYGVSYYYFRTQATSKKGSPTNGNSKSGRGQRGTLKTGITSNNSNNDD